MVPEMDAAIRLLDRGDEQANFSSTQLKAIVISNRIAAAISFLSSLYMMALSFRRRNEIFHRLILGMSTHVMIWSAVHLYGAAAIPKDSPHSWGAKGSIASCTLQGFCMQLFLYSAASYIVCLSIYSFLAVRNNFQVSRYLWVEKWIHLVVHIFPVASALYLLHLEAFNFPGNHGVCYIESLPHGCGNGSETPCTRGPQNISRIQWLFSTLPGICVILVPTLVMLGLYSEVRRKQDKIRIPARTVARQAGIYLGVIYWSVAFAFVNNGLRWVANRPVFVTSLLSTVNLTLLSLWILVFYLYFRRTKIVSSKQAHQISADGQSKRTLSTQRSSVEETMLTSGRSNLTFSIFDGTNAMGEFRDFVFEGDSEDEEADAMESARWQTTEDHGKSGTADKCQSSMANRPST